MNKQPLLSLRKIVQSSIALRFNVHARTITKENDWSYGPSFDEYSWHGVSLSTMDEQACEAALKELTKL